MTEGMQTPESPEITLEQLKGAYQKFLELGVGDPAELELDYANDPDKIAAEEMMEKWKQQIHEEAEREGTEAARLRAELTETTIYVNIGFKGEMYLSDVLDWFYQDIERIPKNDDPGIKEVRTEAANKLLEIRRLLKQAETETDRKKQEG